MAKKLKSIISILVSIIIFTSFISCGKVEDTGRKIVPPEVQKNIITGIWHINKYEIIDDRTGEDSEGKKLLNTNISFGEEVARIGENYFTMPKYKLKVVNSRYYFLHEYKVDINKYDIKDKEAEVISIADTGNCFCELILNNDKDGYLIYNGVIYWITKTSSESESIINNDVKSDIRKQQKAVDESYDMPTGVYLGLKTPRILKKDGTYSEVEYRTLWISFANERLNEVKQHKNILLPRMKGFWELKINENKDKGIVSEKPQAIEKKDGSNKSTIDYMTQNTTDHYEEIMFIGNDYISTAYYTGDNFKDKYNSYKMLPVDNIQVSNGIDIGTLLGDNARKAFQSSYELAISLLPDNQKIKFNNDDLNFENYTMVRRNGHWVLKGKAQSVDNQQTEFAIEYVPPKKLINYDRLYVSWNNIKDVVPSATDAYTSPNSRMALILNKEYIYIYEISKGKIIGEPLDRIELNTGETVIMAEWANGEFVDRWNKFFIGNN